MDKEQSKSDSAEKPHKAKFSLKKLLSRAMYLIPALAIARSTPQPSEKPFLLPEKVASIDAEIDSSVESYFDPAAHLTPQEVFSVQHDPNLTLRYLAAAVDKLGITYTKDFPPVIDLSLITADEAENIYPRLINGKLPASFTEAFSNYNFDNLRQVLGKVVLDDAHFNVYSQEFNHAPTYAEINNTARLATISIDLASHRDDTHFKVMVILDNPESGRTVDFHEGETLGFPPQRNHILYVTLAPNSKGPLSFMTIPYEYRALAEKIGSEAARVQAEFPQAGLPVVTDFIYQTKLLIREAGFR